MTDNDLPVFDGDGHVYENDDEIAEHIEGKWADMERVATFGLFPSLDGWNRSFLVPGVDTHTNVDVWRQMLGELGASGSVLYPTAGLAHGLCQDPDWAGDLATAYNNWLEARYTALDNRLFGAGLMAVQDPKRAVAELERCTRERTGFVSMLLPSRNSTGRSYGDEFFYPIYEAAVREGIPLALHGGPSQGMGFDHLRPFIKVHGLEHPVALFIQITDMVLSGVFEDFPDLRVAFLEAGSSWVPFMMDRLDYEYDFMPHRAPKLTKKPSGYFRDGDNIWVSCEIEEAGLKYCIDAMGSERIIYASDYPHERVHDEFARDVPEFIEEAPYDREVKRRILHDNAVNLYGLNERVPRLNTVDGSDVLVVGGGSAGMFAALALADAADVTLIEAGDDPGDDLPHELLHVRRPGPRYDWGYLDADTRTPVLRGRVLGGSSTVNSAAALRGVRRGYDRWPAGWRWGDCLPAFRAIERDVHFGGSDDHGADGPIVVTRLDPGPLEEAFTELAVELGHPEAPDQNASDAWGVGPWPSNRVNGARWGTLLGVAPLLRDRVRILANRTALRLVVSGSRVTGVEVNHAGDTEVLAADHVVMSCGTVGTPELLFASGIGPGTDLEAAGIQPLVDVPMVGQGLQDHPIVFMRGWFWTRPGAVTMSPPCGTLLRDGLGDDPDDEVQYFPLPARVADPAAHPDEVMFATSIMAPASRGSVRPGPDGTEVRLGLLDDGADRERLAAAASNVLELSQAMVATGHLRADPDQWWAREPVTPDAVAARAMTYNHASATCAMGETDDAVVGLDLSVRGFDNLTIADASAMPTVPAANPNLAAMMLGWRAGTALSGVAPI